MISRFVLESKSFWTWRVTYGWPTFCENLVTSELVGVDEINDRIYVLQAHFRVSHEEREHGAPEVRVQSPLSLKPPWRRGAKDVALTWRGIPCPAG
jgi:hypothetical protein